MYFAFAPPDTVTCRNNMIQNGKWKLVSLLQSITEKVVMFVSGYLVFKFVRGVSTTEIKKTDMEE